MGEGIWSRHLLAPWLIAIKDSEKIIFCNTNSVILLTIVIMIDIIKREVTNLKKNLW